MERSSLFRTLLFAGLFLPALHTFAQPCNFPVTIEYIPPLCQSEESQMFWGIPDGGTWYGPSVSPDGFVDLTALAPGNYLVQYTYTDSSCSTTVSEWFEVQEAHEITATFLDTFDCNNPQPVRIQVTSTGSKTDWSGPGGSGSFFGSSKIILVPKAGEYTFTTAGGGLRCPVTVKASAPQINTLPVTAQDCTPCNMGNIQLCVDTIPPGASVGWSYDNFGYSNHPTKLVLAAGTYYVRLTDSVSTCVSRDTIYVPFTKNSTPSVNAGSDYAIICGGINYLNGAPASDSIVSVLWYTADGNILDTPNQRNPRIDQPGTYIFHAYNSFTGCGNRDTCIVSPYLNTFPHDSVTAIICQGDTLLGYSKSGKYVDRFDIGTDCDSFRVLLLTVLPPVATAISQTICAGETFEGYAATGIFTDVLTGADGCDSMRTLDLTVLPPNETAISQTICAGETFEGYAATGIFTDVFAAENGCDSTRTLNLTVLPPNETAISQTICAGETFEGYAVSGVFTDVFAGADGCDSTRTLDLTVLPPVATAVSQTICAGETFEGYAASGIFTDVFAGADGCDSTRTLNLTVLPPNETAISQTICAGETFEGYAATGIFTDVFAAENGCDSTRTLDLTVLPPVATAISQTICAGETFEGYAASGVFTDVFAGENGCDSTRTLNLTVLPPNETAISQTICAGETFEGYAATGIFTDVLTGADGCDSTRTLDLTVLDSILVDFVVIIPSTGANGSVSILLVDGGLLPYAFSWSTGDTSPFIAQLAPGMYTVTISDAAGCLLVDSFLVGMISGTDTEQEPAGRILFSPNPVRPGQTLRAQPSENAPRLLECVLWDARGRRVYRWETPDAIRQFSLEMPATIAPGMYFLEIQQEGRRRMSQKLLVE
ncbi:MAG: hypothetical protein IPM98_01125 [Lewinellaceae bacterium]|nr:hypothetical protein [Lewinellaceae bacterium]